VSPSASESTSAPIRCAKIAGLVSGRYYKFRVAAKSRSRSEYGAYSDENNDPSTGFRTLTTPSNPLNLKLADMKTTAGPSPAYKLGATLSFSQPRDIGGGSLSFYMILWKDKDESYVSYTSSTEPNCNSDLTLVSGKDKCLKMAASSVSFAIQGMETCVTRSFKVVARNDKLAKWSDASN
jgi:hypothetical protein